MGEGKKRSANAGWPFAHVRVSGLRLSCLAVLWWTEVVLAAGGGWAEKVAEVQ